jgi:5-(carboxyamino)imidazole ribonucleotide mutase
MTEIDVLMLMGSASDWKYLQGAVRVMDDLGLSSRVKVSSAHRTPERTRDLVRQAEADGCRVFICAAGMAAHLAGVVAGHTIRPVLGVPLPGGVLDGVDALLSTVQMPGGIPVATFAVGSAGAKNAAYFAAQIVAAQRSDVAEALGAARQEGADVVETSDAEIQTEIDQKGMAS